MPGVNVCYYALWLLIAAVLLSKFRRRQVTKASLRNSFGFWRTHEKVFEFGDSNAVGTMNIPQGGI